MAKQFALLAALTVPLALVGGGLVVGGETPGLTILDPKDVLAVEFKADRTALVKVTLRNASVMDAHLTLSLFDGVRTTVGVSIPDDSGVAIASPADAGELKVGQIRKLEIGVKAGASADMTKFKGVLIVGATDASITPATINLTASVPGRFTNAKTQPTSITLTVTRCWLSVVPISGDCWLPELLPSGETQGKLVDVNYSVGAPRYRVFVTGTAVDPLPTEIRTFLSSDTGGRLPISLMDFATSDERLTAVVRLGSADRAGKYTGKILLDAPDDKAPSIDVTVNVQDFVLWPLLFLIGGVVGAYRYARSREQSRPREVAAAELGAARLRYLEIAKAARPEERSWMTGLFSENPQDAAAGQSNAVGDQLSRLLRKAATQEDLDRVIKDITDLVKLVDAWPGLRTAAQRLRQMAAQHRIIDSNAQVFRRAETLLRARTSGFTTSEQAKAFLGDLNDQVGAIEIVVRSSRLREEGVRQWALLTPVLKEQLARWNPERFWSAAIRLRATKQELLDADVEAGLIECIREITAHLVFVRDAIAAEFKGVMPTGWAALLAEVDVSAERLARTTVLDVERMRAEAHEPVEWPDPRMVLERVRAFDTREFVISSAVAILAFLLVLYVDKNFGTFWSYLSALLAGLSGALIINWQLLPWYRKYVSVISAKP